MSVTINGTTGIDTIQDGIVSTAKIAADAITTAKIADAVNLGRRNLIINGAMEIAQRSTSVSGVTSTGYHTIDRVRVNGSGGTYNQSQQTVAVGGETGLPSQFTNFLRHECTAGNDNHILMMRNENVRKFTGTMKASFYAKGTNPTTPGYLSVKFHQSFGSGGSSDVYTDAQNFTLTSTWQRFEFDIEMPSLTGKTIGTGSFGSILFGQDVSTSTDAWTLDITGIQWEYGDTATPFEHRSVGEELALCRRYFWAQVPLGEATGGAGNSGQYLIGIGSYLTTNQIDVYTQFPVEMRSAPSMSASSGTDYFVGEAAAGNDYFAAVASFAAKKQSALIYAQNAVSGTAGQAVRVVAANVNTYIHWDAEL